MSLFLSKQISDQINQRFAWKGTSVFGVFSGKNMSRNVIFPFIHSWRSKWPPGPLKFIVRDLRISLSHTDDGSLSSFKEARILSTSVQGNIVELGDFLLIADFKTAASLYF